MTTVQTGSVAAAMFRADRTPPLDRDVAGGRMPEGVAAARQAVEQFVGETFYGMLFKELRKSTSTDHLLSGGAGEATMGPYLDQVLAQRMAQSRHFDVSDAMFDMIYRDTEYSPVRSADQVSATVAKERP
jgi:Rod binding domain-containing protein